MIEEIVIGGHRADVTLTGTITRDEIVDVNEQILGHPDFAQVKRQLWRFRSVSDFRIGPDDLPAIVEIASREPGMSSDMRLAIVVDSALSFGMARMYQAYADHVPWQTLVFERVEDAEAWLGAGIGREA